MNRFGNLLNFDKGHGLSQASKYHGGEERANSSGNLTCVAIAGESASSGDRKEAVAALLLKNILGSGSRVKYGGASGKLAKAVEKIEGQKAVSGLNCSYADSGLTGAFIMCESSIAGKVSEFGKIRIFLLLRFYVKSVSEAVEAQKMPFIQFLMLVNQLSEPAKIYRNHN